MRKHSNYHTNKILWPHHIKWVEVFLNSIFFERSDDPWVHGTIFEKEITKIITRDFHRMKTFRPKFQALLQLLWSSPFQVSLYLVSNYRPSNAIHNYPLCSATIIHPFFLITSAACVHFHYAFNYSYVSLISQHQQFTLQWFLELFNYFDNSCGHLLESQNSRPVSANSFYIVGGNFTEVRSNFGHLQSIHVHPQYNSVTNANNIAIMTVYACFWAKQDHWSRLFFLARPNK